MKHQYSVVYEPTDDGWIVARAPELPGAVSQGRTMAEAREMIEDAVRMLLEYYSEQARADAGPEAVWDTLDIELSAA